MNRHCTEDTQMANEYLKKTFNIIIHYAQQTTMRCHYTPISMSKMKNSDKSRTGKDVIKWITHTLLGERWNGRRTLQKRLTVSYKTKHVIIIQLDSWASILEKWVLSSYKNLHMNVCISFICNSPHVSVSCSDLSNSATLWTVAHEDLFSMEFSRQEYWSR